jgi:hypothetical protein
MVHYATLRVEEVLKNEHLGVKTCWLATAYDSGSTQDTKYIRKDLGCVELVFSICYQSFIRSN